MVNSGLPTSNLCVRALVVSGSSLFAASRTQGVYRSTDNGGTWSSAGLTGMGMVSLAVHGTALFAGGNGVFRSLDGGATWTGVSTGLGADVRVSALAVTGTTLLASTG